jgi:hypothetical protein
VEGIPWRAYWRWSEGPPQYGTRQLISQRRSLGRDRTHLSAVGKGCLCGTSSHIYHSQTETRCWNSMHCNCIPDSIEPVRQKKIHHCHDPDIYSSCSCPSLYPSVSSLASSCKLAGRSLRSVRGSSLVLLDIRVGQDALCLKPPARLLESPCLDAAQSLALPSHLQSCIHVLILTSHFLPVSLLLRPSPKLASDPSATYLVSGLNA